MQRLAFVYLAGVVVACAVLLALHDRSLLRVRRAPALGGAECRSRTVRLHVTSGEHMAFVFEADIGGFATLFLLDTGFAGMPVLSLPVLAEERGIPAASVAESMRLAARAARQTVVAQDQALVRFAAATASVTFAGGCTQLLMGIGENATSTSDTLLAPALRLRATDGGWVTGRACAGRPVAEALATTRMATPHILTIDYLRQAAPVLVAPRAGLMRLALQPAETQPLLSRFERLTNSMIGGAFCAPITVGGVAMRVTLDSGAAVFVALGKSAAARVRRCEAVGEHVTQYGVNREAVCSTVVRADVEFGGATTRGCPIYLNETDLGDCDGYVGAAFLEAYELLILETEVWTRCVGPVGTQALDVTLQTGPCGGAPARCGA